MCGFSGDLCCRDVDFRDSVLKVVLGQNDASGAEGIGLNHIAANLKETGMDVADDIRPTQNQQFVASLFSPEIIDTGIAGLDAGAHGAVVNDNALADGLEKITHSIQLLAFSN